MLKTDFAKMRFSQSIFVGFVKTEQTSGRSQTIDGCVASWVMLHILFLLSSIILLVITTCFYFFFILSFHLLPRSICMLQISGLLTLVSLNHLLNKHSSQFAPRLRTHLVQMCKCTLYNASRSLTHREQTTTSSRKTLRLFYLCVGCLRSPFSLSLLSQPFTFTFSLSHLSLSTIGLPPLFSQYLSHSKNRSLFKFEQISATAAPH